MLGYGKEKAPPQEKIKGKDGDRQQRKAAARGGVRTSIEEKPTYTERKEATVLVLEVVGRGLHRLRLWEPL